MIDIHELLKQQPPKLLNCVHCGLCLDHCPTYRLTGDETNSPRGRLATWRAIDEGRMDVSEKSDFYMDECVGCLACQSACPANVPYAEILADTRAKRVEEGAKVPFVIRLTSKLIKNNSAFQLLTSPIRFLRRFGLIRHKFLFDGKPHVGLSSSAYAKALMDQYKPTGKRVSLLTGCLMEGVFREINFATIRVLIANNIQVIIPDKQVCCGAVLEHAGLPGQDALHKENQSVFESLDVDVVLTNAAGCGLSLKHGITVPTQDVLEFLNGLELVKGKTIPTPKIYMDMPCHLYHGQGVKTAPEKIFDAIDSKWSLAPCADQCCGSGGTYNITKPENSQKILKEKSSFLNQIPEQSATLATANHVCMMQWNSAMKTGLVNKPVAVKHVIQLLDESYQVADIYSA